VRELVDEHYVIRAGWMVGGGAAKDHKFVSRILNQLRAGATTIYAVTDKLGTPTYTPDFARCFLPLIESELYGLYHMACGGEGSRYDVAAHILEILGRNDVELAPVESDFFAAEFPSVRPRSEIMRNLVLDLQGMNTMRPWPIALAEYLHTEFAEMVADVAVA
jgi:dTDP-4-dehydrorhamnose reductase